MRETLKLAKMDQEEISGEMDVRDIEEYELLLERVGELIKRIKASINRTKDEMLDDDKPLEEIASWSKAQKPDLTAFRDVKKALKSRLLEAEKGESTREVQKEIKKQRLINEESTKERAKEQQEIEAATKRKIQLEKEWLESKIQLKKEVREVTNAQTVSSATWATAQSVKLQKYTITPFYGDYKDWLRFWNQFTVEVDGSSISDISKFHYLLELTKVNRERTYWVYHTPLKDTNKPRISCFQLMERTSRFIKR